MFTSILSILGFLPKVLGTVDNITNAIANERLALINAKTASEKQASLERLGQLEAQRSILESDNRAENRTNQIFRIVALGIPLGGALWKLVLYDNILGSFVGCNFKGAHLVQGCMTFGTPNLSDNVWWLLTATACFYLATTMKK